MAKTLNASIAGNIQTFLSRRVVYHVMMWMFYIVTITTVYGSDLGFLNTFVNQTIRCSFYAIVVYFNLYYLIPKYLNQANFLYYSILLLLAVIVISPISSFCQYLFLYFFEDRTLMQKEVLDTQTAQFFLTFMLAGSSTLVKIITDWQRSQRVSDELQKQTMKSEIRFLKSQINPHFLFNTLNSLYALTLKKSDKAPEIVLKLSEMMRYMLYECNEKKVPLENEIKYLQNYLDLERLRQGNKIEITFEIEGDVEDQKIAPLMFIPFLENSFKHGVNHSINTGYVRFGLKVHEKEVDVVISNSKASTPIQQFGKRVGGIGLTNIKRRLELLYGGHYELEIDDQPDEYNVHLKIEL